MIEKLLSEKPDLLHLSAAEPGFFPALLESQSMSNKIGRYDILFAAPAVEIVAYDAPQFNQLLNSIDSSSTANNSQKLIDKSPFQFGWMVYFSYESAYLLETKLNALLGQIKQPLATAIYCQGAVVYDHQEGRMCLFAENQSVADDILSKIGKASDSITEGVSLTEVLEAVGDDFKQAVDKAKELIQSGDIYQANLSRQYQCHAEQAVTPAAIMRQLRTTNPAPFAGMLQLNHFAVVSSSPERLFNIRKGVLETRPIAGTRPRGESQALDAALIEELLNTPKERAEHIMLIDLERNDMGKVCQTGSVEVDELMVIESYQHVHHIVSNIKGILNPDVTFVDVLKALFPGGTITGCPKIRCMEVIRDIEQADRGCYTGSMGYINHDGQVDLNILIRTVSLQEQNITFNTGAGIVYDSDPCAELQETRHKAKGLLNALSPKNQNSQAEHPGIVHSEPMKS